VQTSNENCSAEKQTNRPLHGNATRDNLLSRPAGGGYDLTAPAAR
jgi:hypothetical protein